jgi:hypothetical protein
MASGIPMVASPSEMGKARWPFQNSWGHNYVDEVSELELNATLTLGINLSIRSDQKLIVINHMATKLHVSEGEAQKILNTP